MNFKVGDIARCFYGNIDCLPFTITKIDGNIIFGITNVKEEYVYWISEDRDVRLLTPLELALM